MIALFGGVWIRAQWLNFESADMVSALRLWYDYLALSGSLEALRFRIGTYSPPYLYLLGIAVQIRELYFPGLSQIIAIKAPSLVFDALAAGWMYVLVRRARPPETALVAAAALWLAPTVWLNSAVWGQCDIVYTSLVLLSLVWLCGGWTRSAALSFGVALATKAQAFFVAPLMLYRWFSARRRATEAFFIAAGFLLAMAPALAIGAPARTTVFAYLGQTDEFLGLNFLAPNLYSLVSNNYLDYGTTVGLTATVALSLAFVAIAARYGGRPTPTRLLAVATYLAILAPFLLPRMHERYFFLADVLAIALACLRPRYFWVPLVLQLSSGNAYLQYFDSTAPGLMPAPFMRDATPGFVNLALLVALAAAFVAERLPVLPVATRNELRRVLSLGASVLTVAAIAVAGMAPVFRQPHPAMSLGSATRPQTALSIVYGDEIEVVGIGFGQDRWLRGRPYDVSLHARALRPLQSDYALRIDLYDAQGRSFGIFSTPRLGLSTAAWIPQRVFVIQTLLPVFALSPAPSLLRLGVQWLDPKTGVALPATCAGSACSGKIDGPPIELNMDDTRPYRSATLARFEGVAELASATLTPPVSAATSLSVDLVWRSLQDGPRPMTEYLHVLGSDGKLVGQSDGAANSGRFPSDAWRKNQFILSPRVVVFREPLPPGQYRVFAGLYWSDTQERLAGVPQGAPALPGKSVEIGAFSVP